MTESIVSTADDQALTQQMIRTAIKGGLIPKDLGEKMIAMNRTIGDVTLTSDGALRFDRVSPDDSENPAATRTWGREVMTMGRASDVLERPILNDMQQCPECGHEYTHLVQTVVYQRTEDADTTVIVVSAAGGGAHEIDQGENPSPRRDAVELHFEGECGHRFTVTFCQHKGNTYTWLETA